MPVRGDDNFGMRSGSIPIATIVVLSFPILAHEHDASTQRTDYVQQVERLRQAAAPFRVENPVTPEDVRWKERLDALDQDLDALASATGGVGAPWMWSDPHRPELEAVVESVRPVLAQVVELVHERRGRPLHQTPKLLWSRHRTNLFCAAAIAAHDENEQLVFLNQALDASTCVDDGSYFAWMIVQADTSIVADAAQRLARSSPSSCDRWMQELVPRFERFMSSRDCALRFADYAIQSVDGDWIRDVGSSELGDSLPFLRQVEADIRTPTRTGPIAADVEVLAAELYASFKASNRNSIWLLRPRR